MNAQLDLEPLRLGITAIGWAVLLHEGSPLLVVANALRPLAHPAIHAGRSQERASHGEAKA